MCSFVEIKFNEKLAFDCRYILPLLLKKIVVKLSVPLNKQLLEKLLLPPPATFHLVAPPAIAPIPKLLQYTAPPAVAVFNNNND